MTDIVSHLLRHGANSNIDARVVINGLPSRMQRALHCAARKGDAWLATQTQLLRAQDVNIHKTDSDGKQCVPHLSNSPNPSVIFSTVLGKCFPTAFHIHLIWYQYVGNSIIFQMNTTSCSKKCSTEKLHHGIR